MGVLARFVAVALLVALGAPVAAQNGPTDEKITEEAVVEPAQADAATGDSEQEGLTIIKKRTGSRRFSFSDLSYRFAHEDGSPNPATFHDFELTLGGGMTAGPHGPGYFVGFSGRGRGSYRNQGRRNEGASLSLVFGSMGVMPDPKFIEDSEDDDEMPRSAWTRSGRLQFELGISHISRFEVGAPATSGVGNMDGKTGFRWGILGEQQLLGPIHGRVSYAYEYYSGAAHLMDMTWMLHMPIKLFDDVSLSFGHRTFRARGYKRTMLFVGLEFSF
jgi:hypothetical protein